MQSFSKIREITKDILLASKHVIIHIENDPVLDDMILRFPTVVDAIFKELDNQSVAKCRNVSGLWCEFIDNQKLPWIRKIQKFKRKSDKFNQQWKEAFKNAPINIVKEVSVAVQCNYESVIKKKGSKTQKVTRKWTLLHIFAEQGLFEMCQYLIEKIDDKNPLSYDHYRNPYPHSYDGPTPLHLAAQNGYLEVCKIIIRNVKDKNPRYNKGVTVLHNAAENGHLEVWKLISANTDDKNPTTLDGYTPLHLAVKNGHLEMCKLILAITIDKNPAALDGCTPLHLAVKNGHFQVCKLLLDNGIDKNPVYNGETPLQLAIIDMRLRIVSLFIENGMDVVYIACYPDARICFYIMFLSIAALFGMIMYHEILSDWK